MEFEQLAEVSETLKDSTETINEVTKDSSFQFQPNGSIGVDLQVVDIELGASASTTDALKDFTKSTVTHIDETVARASARLKATRHTKVEETIEIGREERVTRKVRNPNLCRTLNLTYFEELANYRVDTFVVPEQARLCVLVPNPAPWNPSRAFIRTHEHVLRPVLLARELETGFDAAKMLAARDRLCDIACTRCECEAPAASAAAAPSDGQMTPLDQAIELLRHTYHELRLQADNDDVIDLFKAARDRTPMLSAVFACGCIARPFARPHLRW